MRPTPWRQRDSLRAAAAALGGALLIVLALGSAPTAGATPAAAVTPVVDAADSGAESGFVASVNSVRQAHGLPPLQVYGELVGIARGWADQMASAGGISHNPSLSGSVSAPWKKLGENVGAGYDVGGLMNAFINSPAHYRNIVDPQFNYIGVGVSYGADGRMYTTHDFMYIPDGGDASADSAPTPDVNQNHTRSAPDPAPPAADPAPEAAPPPPPPPPPPPADPVRVHVMLSALRAVSD